MTLQKTSKAATRRERASEANHLGMDTAAAGMAAGGLGLALLHHQMSEAKAATTDGRGVLDTASAPIDRSVDGPADRAAEHTGALQDDRSELLPSMSDPHAASQADPGMKTDMSMAASEGHGHQDLGAALMDGDNSTLAPTGDMQTAASPAFVDHLEPGHSPASGLQSFLSGASSAVSDIAHGLEQRLDAITSAAGEAINASLSVVSHQLSSLTSHIGELVTDSAEHLSQAANATTDLASDVASTVPAIVDPIFHQAFGPASEVQSFAGDVVDTSGLASFGSAAHDAPIAFVGQSYTELADHTVHGLQGLTHGLV